MVIKKIKSNQFIMPRSVKTKLVIAAIIVASLASTLAYHITHAASLASWNPGLVITDDIFTNSGSLNPTQIQAFLESKVPNCDTWGTQPSEFGGGTRAQWGTAHGYPPPYTCLKDYVENGLNSANIIYNSAQQYQINPEVLIVLLQKEQGLVTDTWPLSVQYRTATGYGCPDSSVCDSQYYGLTNQIQWAAKMYRAIENASPTWYTPYLVGNNYIQYNPNSGCGGTNVNIANRATQALYNYTPYQPNQAALNAGYGAGDSCSSYGNRNFYLYFTDWFGSTISPPNFNWRVADQQVVINGTPQSSTVVNINPGQTMTLIVKAKNTGNQTWSNTNVTLGTSHPNDRASVFSNNSWPAYNRPAILQETTVVPGATGTFQFTITAPNKLQSTQEYFNILTEGITWQQDIGMYFLVNVVNPAGEYYNVSITGQKLFTDTARTQPYYGHAAVGSKLYGTLSFTNTGNSPLSNVSALLATDSPRDRTSILQDASWISSNRLSAISNSSLQPGQSGSVNYTLQVPSAVGTDTEDFGMLVEGKAWMDLDKATVTVNSVPTPVTNLPVNGYLDPGQYLSSQDLRHQLVLQSDGNLVLYSNGQPIWATYTMGAANPRLIMQSDGNLVLYAQGGRPVWASRTAGHGATTLVLQNDRNLVAYPSSGGASWATYTNL